MDLQGKKVIVFGGAGFIGRALCSALAKYGAAVTAFDRDPIPECETIRCIQGDFFDDAQLKAAARDQDLIVHAICTINPGSSVEHYMRGYEKDFVQSAKLCDLAFRQGKRLLFLSSGGTVYGSKSTPLTEDDPKCPINHYGSLKLCIETMIQTFIHTGADFRIARIANAYGPGQDYRKGVGFIDAAIKKALTGETIEVWGDGSIIRDYIHIDDICHMLCDVLMYDGEEHIFNIGTGEGISQKEILSLIAHRIAEIKITYSLHRIIDTPVVILDTERYQKRFAFKPRDISTGVYDYLEWLITH